MSVIVTGADIHDGETLHQGKALYVQDTGAAAIITKAEADPAASVFELDGGMLAPAWVDLQVNGGGGVMFNDAPNVNTLRTMAQAHARIGTGALLATLITDTPEKTQAAIDAVIAAIDEKVPGIAGIHLEGPHLSVARKGAHEAGFIRPMDTADVDMLLRAADQIENVMVTVAPENCTSEQIAMLADAGIVVSLGHTDAAYGDCMAAFDAGARCATHLFNAMSQLSGRTPGLVGAVLARDDVCAGIIADGIHVHPAAIQIALAHDPQAQRFFLVSDSMATGGTDLASFTLNGRVISRDHDRLTLADGTLAGAHTTLDIGTKFLQSDCGQPKAQAIARATNVPASLLAFNFGCGRFEGTLDGLNYHGPDNQTYIPFAQHLYQATLAKEATYG